MVVEGWRGWGKVVVVAMLAAAVAFFGLVELRQMAVERQQLREVVALIQQGRIQVGPPPQPPPAPAPTSGQAPAEKPKP